LFAVPDGSSHEPFARLGNTVIALRMMIPQLRRRRGRRPADLQGKSARPGTGARIAFYSVVSETEAIEPLRALLVLKSHCPALRLRARGAEVDEVVVPIVAVHVISPSVAIMAMTVGRIDLHRRNKQRIGRMCSDCLHWNEAVRRGDPAARRRDGSVSMTIVAATRRARQGAGPRAGC